MGLLTGACRMLTVGLCGYSGVRIAVSACLIGLFRWICRLMCAAWFTTVVIFDSLSGDLIVLLISAAGGRVSRIRRLCTNLVDPASSHMLVSKIKPCMSQYKLLYGETANGSLKQL